MQAQGQESIQTPRKTKNSDRTDGTVLNVSIWASKCALLEIPPAGEETATCLLSSHLHYINSPFYS